MKLIIFCVLIVVFCSCQNSASLDNESEVAMLNHKSNGCISEMSLEKSNSDPTLDWTIENNTIDLNLNFSANCASSFKDSLVIADDNVDIYLVDTCKTFVHCICDFREEFKFEVFGKESINIKFNYVHERKSINEVLIEETINLNEYL